MKTVSRCRSCESPKLSVLMSFGDTPIADRLVPINSTAPEFSAPLTLCICTSCGLCQILETIEPRELFGADYPYFSSVSPALIEHFHASASRIARRTNLNSDDLVLEAASNDGYMLQAFQKMGYPVLGVDPADGPVQVARDRKVPTIHDFFSLKLARSITSNGPQAKIFLANNILAHVADVNNFVAGIREVLRDDGVAVVEVPYLIDLVDGGAFDTIYHQHLMYFSLSALLPLLQQHGFYINDVERLWIHGGSIRIFFSREKSQSAQVAKMLETERSRRVTSPEFFSSFVNRINELKDAALQAFHDLKSKRMNIAGYGAAAKATTLLHVLGVDQSDLEFIVDKSCRKQGLRMPGIGIPIISPEHIYLDEIDAVLILAWNFSDEIIHENKRFLVQGGRFLVPIPNFHEVTKVSNPLDTYKQSKE